MKGFSFVTAVLLVAAGPAAAQDRLWGHSGAWEVRQGELACTFRYRATDAAATELVFEQRFGGGLLLKASGKGWRYGTGKVPGLVLEADGVVIDGSISPDFNPAAGREGFQMYLKPAIFSRLVAARRIAVQMPGYPGEVPIIAMPPSMTVEQDLAACIADVGTREDGSGEPAVTPPLSRGTVASWTTTDDYPMPARRAEIGGHLHIRLRVNAHTRVTACEVVESTGNALLDTSYCAIYRRRARFSTPPRDARGRPTRGSFDIIRELVPPPMPPRPTLPDHPMP